jgi:4-oxalocrotonate tautomerase
MPAITIQSLELTDEQKKVIAKKFGETFSELTKVPIDRIYIFFDGYTLDNAATNGVLFAESPPKIAVGKFSQQKEGEK